MTTEALLAQVKGLQVQLSVVKAQMRSLGRPAPSGSFADLEGILAGEAESTESEIEAAEYRPDWGDEGDAGT